MCMGYNLRTYSFSYDIIVAEAIVVQPCAAFSTGHSMSADETQMQAVASSRESGAECMHALRVPH